MVHVLLSSWAPGSIRLQQARSTLESHESSHLVFISAPIREKIETGCAVTAIGGAFPGDVGDNEVDSYRNGEPDTVQ